MAKKVRLYVGAPGSGKTTAARKECNFVIDDPKHIELFEDIQWFADGVTVGVTCAHMIDVISVRRLAEHISKFDAVLQEVIVFDGTDEALMNNVLLRGDISRKPVHGLIRCWNWTRHALFLNKELELSGEFHFSYREVEKYA